MESKANPNPPEKEHPVFEFEVDGDEYTTTEHDLTPIQIMTLAGIDPGTHYLVQTRGHDQVRYQDNPNKEIHMHNHMEFSTNYMGPTTVS